METLTTIYHLALDKSQKIQFKPITSVDHKYLAQAVNMASTFTEAVETRKINNKEVPYWNMKKGIEIVKKHPEMAIVKILNTTEAQQTADASLMADKVFNAINAALEAYFQKADKEQMIKSIENAFSNLAQEKDGAWIFWQKEEEHKTTYDTKIT